MPAHRFAHLGTGQYERSPRTDLMQKKRREEKKTQPTRNAIFAKFSRENLAQIGLQKCLLRYGENMILWKKVFTSAVPCPLGCFCCPGACQKHAFN